jgi:hypothetical protein
MTGLLDVRLLLVCTVFKSFLLTFATGYKCKSCV